MVKDGEDWHGLQTTKLKSLAVNEIHHKVSLLVKSHQNTQFCHIWTGHNTKMSNNPAKCEVLIKRYFRSILDVSALWLFQLTRNLKLWSQDFSFDEKRWQFISNWKAKRPQWPKDWWIQQWYFPHLGTGKNTNRKSIMNRENMMVHVLPIPPISFPFRFSLKAKHGYVGALELVVRIKRYLEPRNKHRHRDWRYPLRNTGSLRNDDGDCQGKA